MLIYPHPNVNKKIFSQSVKQEIGCTFACLLQYFNMKKSILFAAVIFIASIGFNACVTKQKYEELNKNYKDCMDEKQFTSNELADCQNHGKNLTQQVNALDAKVNELKQDTLSLTRKLAQSEKDYAKMKMDYDELLQNISQLSKSSSATIDTLSGDLKRKEKELNTLQRKLDEQAEQLKNKEDSLNASMKSLAELQNALNQKDAEVRALKEKVSNALRNFEGSGLKVEERNGKVYVSMDEKLLFASGKWEVQAQGKEALSELAKVLEADSTINVLIEGHTDNVPMTSSSQVKDNWDLSVMRATAVVKIILANGEINPQRISASGRGEFLPIDPENTPEARAKNRRTEIILTPNLNELFQIIDAN